MGKELNIPQSNEEVEYDAILKQEKKEPEEKKSVKEKPKTSPGWEDFVEFEPSY